MLSTVAGAERSRGSFAATFGMVITLALIAAPVAHAITIVSLGERLAQAGTNLFGFTELNDPQTSASLGEFSGGVAVSSPQSFGGAGSLLFESDRTNTQIILSTSTFHGSVGASSASGPSRAGGGVVHRFELHL